MRNWIENFIGLIQEMLLDSAKIILAENYLWLHFEHNLHWYEEDKTKLYRGTEEDEEEKG